MKNTLEGIHIKVDDAEGQIGKAEDKVLKKHPTEPARIKGNLKNEDSLRDQTNH